MTEPAHLPGCEIRSGRLVGRPDPGGPPPWVAYISDGTCRVWVAKGWINRGDNTLRFDETIETLEQQFPRVLWVPVQQHRVTVLAATKQWPSRFSRTDRAWLDKHMDPQEIENA